MSSNNSNAFTEQQVANLQLASSLIDREMKRSAIHPALVAANVHKLEGDEIVDLLVGCTSEALGKHSKQYATAAVSRYQELYKPLAANGGGGWAVFGCTLAGTEGTVPIVKPNRPRVDFANRNKRVKYETPAKCVGAPILSFVPESVAERTWERFSADSDPTKTYWQNVRALDLPITITEGWKKAASLISQGYPALALRGITMWHPKGDTSKVHSEIEQFCTKNRRFYICFDQDTKESTRKNVHKQAVSLGWCLRKSYNAAVQLLTWASELGKGIDDVLVGAGDEAQRTLCIIYQNAMGLTLATYGSRDEQIQTKIAAATTLTLKPERSTTGEHMPTLPMLKKGKIHLVDAGMGSGKTVRIGSDWVNPLPQCSLVTRARLVTPFTLLITPMNALGRQTAQRWGLTHIHDLRGENVDYIWGLAKDNGGMAMCADSLHKLPDWLWSEPLLLVFDEVNQTLDNLTSAGTTGDRQSPILKILANLCRHALATGSIVAAEDGILRHSVQFLMKIAGVGKGDVRLFQHARIQSPWSCIMHTGNISQVSGFRAEIIRAASEGQKILFVTSSQLEGKSLERALARFEESKSIAAQLIHTPDGQFNNLGTAHVAPVKTDAAHLKVVRVDSETNEGKALQHFFTNPDQWIEDEQPDVLIISPSAKSGVSIEIPYFDEVWAFFPSLDATTHWQLLGRYRQPVTRHIFTPERVMLSPLEQMGSARRIRRYLEDYSQHLTTHLGISAALNHSSETPELDQEIEAAMMDFYCYHQVLQGAQKSTSLENLMNRLERAGHKVGNVDLVHNSLVADMWANIREELEIEEAEALAAAQILDKHTSHWAYQQLNSKESSFSARIIAQKVLLRIDFPGMMFDGVEECHKGITQYKGLYKKGTVMYAKLLDIDSTRELEKHRALEILNQDIKALHRLPKNYIKAKLLIALGIPELLETLESLELYNSDAPEVECFKQKALVQKDKIWMFLGLNIDEEQTGIEILHKIIKKHLGIRTKTKDKDGLIESFKLGPRGEQIVFYCLQTKQCEIYQQMLQSAQLRLRNRISDFLEQENNQEITDTANALVVDKGHAVSSEVVLDRTRYRVRAQKDSLLWLAPVNQPEMPLELCLVWDTAEAMA